MSTIDGGAAVEQVVRLVFEGTGQTITLIGKNAELIARMIRNKRENASVEGGEYSISEIIEMGKEMGGGVSVATIQTDDVPALQENLRTWKIHACILNNDDNNKLTSIMIPIQEVQQFNLLADQLKFNVVNVDSANIEEPENETAKAKAAASAETVEKEPVVIVASKDLAAKTEVSMVTVDEADITKIQDFQVEKGKSMEIAFAESGSAGGKTELFISSNDRERFLSLCSEAGIEVDLSGPPKEENISQVFEQGREVKEDIKNPERARTSTDSRLAEEPSFTLYTAKRLGGSTEMEPIVEKMNRGRAVSLKDNKEETEKSKDELMADYITLRSELLKQGLSEEEIRSGVKNAEIAEIFEKAQEVTK